MRERVIGYRAKILHAPFPFLFGPHAASEITPTAVVDAAEQPRAGLHAQIDEPFSKLRAGGANCRIGRNNVRVRGHADLDDNIEPEIRSALPHELRWEIIDVERDDVHGVEAHGFGLVQQREVPLCECFAEQEGVDAEFHRWLRGSAPHRLDSFDGFLRYKFPSKGAGKTSGLSAATFCRSFVGFSYITAAGGSRQSRTRLGKWFCHRAQLDFNNPRAWGLFAGQ